MKTAMIIDEVYGSVIRLVWNAKPKAIMSWVKRHVDPSAEHDGSFKGRTIEYVDPRTKLHVIIIALPVWTRTNYDISVLVHECFHAVEYIMKYHDVPHSKKTSEPWAYYLDSLVRRSLEKLR